MGEGRERERETKSEGERVLRGETIAFPLAGFLSSYRNSIDNTPRQISFRTGNLVGASVESSWLLILDFCVEFLRHVYNMCRTYAYTSFALT